MGGESKNRIKFDLAGAVSIFCIYLFHCVNKFVSVTVRHIFNLPRFEAVKTYKKSHFKEPPRLYQAILSDGRKLNIGKWCDTQRFHKKKVRLTPEREMKLNVRS